MLTVEKMTPNRVAKLLELIEIQTRNDVASRIGDLPMDVYLGTATEAVEALDRIREYIFGTSDLVELAYEFGILKKKVAKKKVIRKERL